MSIQGQHIPPREERPPTALPVDEKNRVLLLSIVEEIKKRKAGKITQDGCSEYVLERAEYNDLLRLLQGNRDMSLWGFVKHKLRYDYFPSTNKFILRTPAPICELLAESIIEEIQHQLHLISSKDGKAAEFAAEVKSEASTAIDFEEPEFGSHDPDGQFRHSKVNYPGVVLEVSDSQEAKDVTCLANEYILGSDGDIRVVIGVNLEDKEASNATLCVWEPRSVRNIAGEDKVVAVEVVANQIFRDEKGKPNESAEINLQLQHFAMEAFAQEHGALQDTICISAQMLCEFLDRAAGNVSVRQELPSLSEQSKPGVLKRSRETTPGEKHEERHEKRFRDDETREEEKVGDDDC